MEGRVLENINKVNQNVIKLDSAIKDQLYRLKA